MLSNIAALYKANKYNPFSAYTLYDNKTVIQNYINLIKPLAESRTDHLKLLILGNCNTITSKTNNLSGKSIYKLEIRDNKLVVVNMLDVNVKWVSYWGLIAAGTVDPKLATPCILIPHIANLLIEGISSGRNLYNDEVMLHISAISQNIASYVSST